MDDPPLIPDQRRQKILRLLERHHVLSVHQLTELLGVSHMTVRRDIAELEQIGAASPVAGGVRYVGALSTEPSFDMKTLVDEPQKAAIAEAATRFLRDDGVYYLDAGTTTAALLPALREHRGVTVVTNDLPIATALTGDTAIDVVLLGGRLDHANRSVVGPLAASTVRQLAVDVAFVSATSWDLQRGVTTPDPEKVVVKEAALTAATKAVLLSASSKYASYSMYRVAPLDRFAAVVTDDGLDPSDAEALRAAGIDLLLAETSARVA
jgi:DeoR/GlpR family transcriptional regulator of sugar metabolism